MNLFDELGRKLEGLGQHARKEGIKAAIRHIHVAERYLIRGREDEDPDAFNDVIYRTNQAFEGMLKEAHSVLTGKDGPKLSTHAIEQQHLVDSGKLTPRVLALFTKYRQDWRNTSTHDHTLLFDEDEALLAIVSVSAFAIVLLDQIIETASFKRERKEAERKRPKVTAPHDHAQASLEARVLDLLSSFVPDSGRPETATEAELIGRMSGHIVGLDPSIQVIHDAQLGGALRADLLLEWKGQKLVIEVKRARPSTRMLEAATAQVEAYLSAAGATNGIVYLATGDRTTPRKVVERSLDDGRKVWLLIPGDHPVQGDG